GAAPSLKTRPAGVPARAASRLRYASTPASSPLAHSEPAVHLRGTLLELVLRAQEAGGNGAIGQAIEDEGPFEHIEDVHDRMQLPGPRRLQVFSLQANATDLCGLVHRHARLAGEQRYGLDDFVLGDWHRSLPREEVDDERDVGLRDFIVACAATHAVRRNDGGGWGWRLKEVVHLV